MELSKALQQRIVNICKEKGLTLNKLATNSGISYSTLFSIFYGKSKSPQISTILHICEGFNITLGAFFDDPLFNDVEFEEDHGKNISDII